MVHVLGTGSYALEIAEYARAQGLEVAGLIEALNPERVGTTIHGLRVRDAADLPEPGAAAVVGLQGDRRAHWAALQPHGWAAATLCHPAAHVAASVQRDQGSIVGPGCVLGAAATIREQALIGRGSLIGHHTEIGPGAIVNPGCNVGGNARIGAGAYLGMGAIVVNGIEVGEGAVVAAGAVVLRPVEAGTSVRGIPAQPYQSKEG